MQKHTQSAADKQYHTKINGKRTPTYITWQSMKSRCIHKGNASYKDYGGRGISFCDKWKKFKNFVDDMGMRPIGMQLNRIDNNSNYSKDNCNWVTPKTNARHRRNSNMITYNGKTQCIAAWAEYAGFGWHVIALRLNRGWTVKDAIEKELTIKSERKIKQ